MYGPATARANSRPAVRASTTRRPTGSRRDLRSDSDTTPPAGGVAGGPRTDRRRAAASPPAIHRAAAGRSAETRPRRRSARAPQPHLPVEARLMRRDPWRPTVHIAGLVDELVAVDPP